MCTIRFEKTSLYDPIAANRAETIADDWQVEKSYDCNTPKYTLVVFDIFRVFCKPNLTVL